MFQKKTSTHIIGYKLRWGAVEVLVRDVQIYAFTKQKPLLGTNYNTVSGLPEWAKEHQLGYFWQPLMPKNSALAPCYFWVTFWNACDHFGWFTTAVCRIVFVIMLQNHGLFEWKKHYAKYQNLYVMQCAYIIAVPHGPTLSDFNNFWHQNSSHNLTSHDSLVVHLS